MRGVLRRLGSIAIEGPVISWVADHRKHHAFSDRVRRPAQPARRARPRLARALRGLAHAHVGWLFVHTQRGNKRRYAPDLLSDPVVAWFDRTFIFWAIGGFPIAVRARLPDRRALVAGRA